MPKKSKNYVTIRCVMYTLLHIVIIRAHSFPRRRLPNSAAHCGKFLEFRGSPRPPILEYTVPTLAQLWVRLQYNIST